MLTKAERDEIRARADAATKGPWREGPPGNFRVYGPDATVDSGPVAEVVARRESSLQRARNRVFIAHARTDIPALLDALDAQDAEVARLTADNDRLIVIAKADEWQARYWAEHDAVADREATIMAERAAAAAMREKASALAEAMETCHVCQATVIVEGDPTHCEKCSSDCDSHAEPECVGLDVLHMELQFLLRAGPK